MRNMENIVEEVVEYFANTFGIDILSINVDMSEIINEYRADKLRQIIANSEKMLIASNKHHVSIHTKMKHLADILLHASLIDADDLKTLSEEEYKNYYNILNSTRAKYSNIMIDLVDNIDDMRKSQQVDATEDLTKLSKEELIERLRRK